MQNCVKRIKENIPDIFDETEVLQTELWNLKNII